MLLRWYRRDRRRRAYGITEQKIISAQNKLDGLKDKLYELENGSPEIIPNDTAEKAEKAATKTEHSFRKAFSSIRSKASSAFSSVSRMSRNAKEGIEQYMELLDKGIELVLLKEPYVNTENYKQALSGGVELVGNDIADVYIEATNKVLKLLAAKQIELAFEQSEKEVMDIRQRTKEGIETARLNGKQIGLVKGSKLIVKKEAPAKELIRKHCKTFGGTLNDIECIKLANLSRNTYYKYKREIKEELTEE